MCIDGLWLGDEHFRRGVIFVVVLVHDLDVRSAVVLICLLVVILVVRIIRGGEFICDRREEFSEELSEFGYTLSRVDAERSSLRCIEVLIPEV